MLGRRISDPDGVDGVAGDVAGLGHLDIETVMAGQKRLALQSAVDLQSGETVSGYEIHMGQTTGPDCDRAWLSINGRPEGAASANGRIMGCYLHGLFASDAFRKTLLERLGTQSSTNYEGGVEAALDALADHLARNLDTDSLLALAADVPLHPSS